MLSAGAIAGIAIVGLVFLVLVITLLCSYILCQAQLLGTCDQTKMTFTSFCSSTFARICCCGNDSATSVKERVSPENMKRCEERRWSNLEGKDGSLKSEEEIPLRGKPDGKEKSRSNTGISRRSAGPGSSLPDEERIKMRYSGNDFDVIDLDEDDHNKTEDEARNALARSAECEMQDQTREFYGRRGFRNSIFNKLSDF